MLVHELIDELKKFDEGAFVLCLDIDGYSCIPRPTLTEDISDDISFCKLDEEDKPFTSFVSL